LIFKNRKQKGGTMKQRVFVASLCAPMLFSVSAWAQGGASGATLQASKTLDICNNGDGTWKYSGEVSVWNTGAANAQGLNIADCLQYKATSDKKDPRNVACLTGVQGGVTTIPGLTQETEAVRFAYNFNTYPYMTPLDPSGTIRNSAQVNITNHSGGNVTGPNPKYTWTGGTPPLCTPTQGGGCTFTQGYWDNKPGVVWPASGPQRTDLFFGSGLTYQQIMDASVSGGNGYINLAHQYIAAVLNVANGAAEPSTVVTYINLSTGFFSGFPVGQSFCSSGGQAGNCSLQVTWAGILADYNQGTAAYAGNPGHCAE
jgi:hypothetical protein